MELDSDQQKATLFNFCFQHLSFVLKFHDVQLNGIYFRGALQRHRY